MNKPILIAAAALSLLSAWVEPVGAVQIYVDNPAGSEITVGHGLVYIDIFAMGNGELVSSVDLYLSIAGDPSPPLMTKIVVNTPGMLFQPPLWFWNNFPLTGDEPTTQAYAAAMALDTDLRTLVPAGTSLATVKLDTSAVASNGHWQLNLFHPRGSDPLLSTLTDANWDIMAGVTLTGGNIVTSAASGLSTWVYDGSGSWTAAGKWDQGAPNSSAHTATFEMEIIGGSAAITLDGGKTVGLLKFSSSPSTSYTVNPGSPTGMLHLDNGSGAATVEVANGGSHTVNATVRLDAAAVTVNTVSGADKATFGGQVQGSGKLIKDGAGTVVLSVLNNYKGGTQVKAGIVQLGNKNALGSGALEMAGSTAVVDLNGVGAVVSSLKGTAGKITDLATGTGTSLLEVQNSTSQTYAGLIEDDTAGGKNKIAVKMSGAGEVILTSAPRYTGDTEVASGTLFYEVAGGTTKVDGNATLTIDGVVEGVGPGKVNVSGIDPFTDETNPALHTAVVNNSPGLDDGEAGFNLLAGATTTIKSLSGNGTTSLGAGATLNTGSLVQDVVTIAMGARGSFSGDSSGSSSGGNLTLAGGNIATSVPEPSTLMLGAIVGALALPLLGFRRKRAKRA